jgi:hypothetical protein
MAEVGVHVSESDDLVAEMTFGSASSIYQLVWGETGKHHLGIVEIRVGVAFLGHEKVTKLAENQLSWTVASAVLGKSWETFEDQFTVGTLVVRVENSVMFFFARGVVAMARVVRAVPVILPFWRSFLKHGLALCTEDIIAETEVLVQNECPLRNPLLAVLALHVARLVRLVLLFR